MLFLNTHSAPLIYVCGLVGPTAILEPVCSNEKRKTKKANSTIVRLGCIKETTPFKVEAD